MKIENTRRNFLKHAGLGLLVVPAASLTSGLSDTPPHQSKLNTNVLTAKVSLNVKDFGATGDGLVKDTYAIQQAIDRCNILGGGEVIVPAGKYLTGAIQLRSNVFLRLEKDAILMGSGDLRDYQIMQVRWEGKWIAGYSGLIFALGANNIGIGGPGKVEGNSTVGGRPTPEKPLRRPALIEPIDCTNITFDGFSTEYRLMWSIHLTYCDNVTIKNLFIRSTGGNGDGIDVDSCRHVTIDGCDIATGDDCISLKSGRGMEGYTLMRTTEDVHISNCTFADSIFACIGIGSETSGGIRNVLIENCKFTAAKTFALYIKSRVGRGAFIENIRANNLEVSGMEGGFLRFNLSGSGLQDQVPVPGLEGIPTTKNLSFTNIKVTNVPVLVDGTGIHPLKPLEGFTLSNITGTCQKGISLANIKNASIKQINVTGFTGPLISVYNVKGSGVKDATILPEPKAPEPIVAPATPYQLK